MILPAWVLRIGKLVSKSKVRHELTRVLVRDNKVVATDEFKLVEVTLPVSDGANIAIPGKEIVKLKPKDGSVQLFAVPGAEKYMATFIHDGGTIVIDAADGKTYPNYEKVFPTEDPVAEINVSAALLKDVVEFMSKVHDLEPENAKLHIEFFGKGRPIVFKMQDVRAMLMPLNK